MHKSVIRFRVCLSRTETRGFSRSRVCFFGPDQSSLTNTSIHPNYPANEKSFYCEPHALSGFHVRRSSTSSMVVIHDFNSICFFSLGTFTRRMSEGFVQKGCLLINNKRTETPKCNVIKMIITTESLSTIEQV